MMGKDKKLEHDERFTPCNDIEGNVGIYKKAVREIEVNSNYSPEEKKERIKLEKLLVLYRAELSLDIPKIMSKSLGPALFLNYQKKELSELVKKYDDPQKLSKEYNQGLKEGILKAFLPSAQIELFKFKLSQSKEYQETVEKVQNHAQELNSAIEKADYELGEKPLEEKDGKNGLASFLQPGKADKQQEASEGEPGLELSKWTNQEVDVFAPCTPQENFRIYKKMMEKVAQSFCPDNVKKGMQEFARLAVVYRANISEHKPNASVGIVFMADKQKERFLELAQNYAPEKSTEEISNKIKYGIIGKYLSTNKIATRWDSLVGTKDAYKALFESTKESNKTIPEEAGNSVWTRYNPQKESRSR